MTNRNASKFTAPLFLFLFLLLSLFLTSCAQIAGETFTEGPELIIPAAMRLETATAERGMVTEQHIIHGSVRVLSEAIGFKRSGFFYESFANMGEEVYEGQLLATLNAEAALEAAEEIRDRIRRIQSRHSLERRQEELAIEVLMYEQSAAERQASLLFDPAMVERANHLREQVEWAQLNLRHANQNRAAELENIRTLYSELHEDMDGIRLYAPFDGIITSAWNPPGDMYLEAESSIFSIAPLDQIPFVEYMGPGPPEEDVPMMLIRSVFITANIGGVTYELTSLPLTRDQQFFYAIGAGADGATILPMRFAFTENNPALPPIGEIAVITIYTYREENALRVPVSAVFSEAGVHGPFYVIRIVGEQRINTPVTVAIQTDMYAVITSGLSEGDEVHVR